MALRGSALLPSAISKTLICIDAISGYEFSGRLFSPFMPRIVVFCGVKGIVDALDGFFDEIGFPQTSYAARLFNREKKAPLSGCGIRSARTCVTRYFDDDAFNSLAGSIATFTVHIRLRRNATWQGSVEWRDKGLRYDFKSALELIRLMSEAVRESSGEWIVSGW